MKTLTLLAFILLLSACVGTGRPYQRMQPMTGYGQPVNQPGQMPVQPRTHKEMMCAANPFNC